jgi:hypothetical protein
MGVTIANIPPGWLCDVPAHINLGNPGKKAHHVQAAATRHLLQGEDIATGAQISNREGAPELVRVLFFRFVRRLVKKNR